MALQVLIESTSGKLEISKDKDEDIFFEGMFGKAIKRNLNGRVYPYKVMKEAIKNYNENYVKQHRACLELDHPDSAEIVLKNISCVIEEPLILKENGDVYGKAKVLKNTPMGAIAYELFKSGITVGISSRGLGEIETKKVYDEELKEEVEINEVNSYSIEAFDLVSSPSIGEFVKRSQSTTESTIPQPIDKKIVENITPNEKTLTAENLINLSEILFD